VAEILTNNLLQTTWIEELAVIFSIAYVILAAYQNNWCWLAAIISVSLYIYICFIAKLYSETGLQVFYLGMAFYGWWQWTKKFQNNKTVAITKLNFKKNVLIILLGIGITLPFYFLTKNYTDAALPFSDALVTAFSLITTFMVTKKILENWIYWIVIDSLAVYIYLNRGLQLTAVLYFIYVIIAVVGFINWRKEYLRHKA
jgi:nicotinamide mononucleotide transporter